MKALLIIFLGLLTASLCGQPTWFFAYGAGGQDNAYSVERTFDGKYLVAGSTGSFGGGNSDAYLLKVDTNGQRLWSRYYGGSEIEEIRSVTTAADSGIVMVGHTNGWGYGGYDVLMIKADSAGNQLWDKTFGGPDWEFGMDVELMTDGGFLICGTTFSFGNGNSDVYLIRTDHNGDTLWTRTVGFSGTDDGNAIDVLPGGGAIIVGSTNSKGSGGFDVFMMEVDAGGDTLWTNTYGGVEDELGNDLAVLSNGNITIAGSTESFNMPLIQTYSVLTDNGGTQVWERAWGVPGNSEGFAVVEDQDGNFQVAAYNDFYGTGGKDLWLLFLDQQGDFSFGATCGGLQDEVIYDLDTTLAGGFVLAGTTESYGSGQRDVTLMGSDAMGPVNCQGANVVFDPLLISEYSEDLIEFNLWPNPAIDMVQLDIQLDGNLKDVSIEVIDLSGRSVKFEDLNGSYSSISVGDLNKGSYIVVLKQGAEVIARTILVKAGN